MFAYYVCNSARASFDKMARATGGECQDLDVRTSGAKKLKEAVVKRVLFDIGRNEGDGTKSNEPRVAAVPQSLVLCFHYCEGKSVDLGFDHD